MASSPPSSAKSYKAPKSALSRVSKRKQSEDPSPSMNKHARSPKACERCRNKKTKCDGKTPCQRCKDDSQLCCYGMRKSGGLKRPPLGYAEMLEDSNQTLVSAMKKLYSMFEDELTAEGEVRKNEKGEPIISDIVEILGFARRLPDNERETEFPQDSAELQKLRNRMMICEEDGEERKDSLDSISSVAMKREDSSSSHHSSLSRSSHTWSNNGEVKAPVPRRAGGSSSTHSGPEGGLQIQKKQSMDSLQSSSSSNLMVESPMSLAGSEDPFGEPSLYPLGDNILTASTYSPNRLLNRQMFAAAFQQMPQATMRHMPDVQTIAHYRDNGFGISNQQVMIAPPVGTIRPDQMHQTFSFDNMDFMDIPVDFFPYNQNGPVAPPGAMTPMTGFMPNAFYNQQSLS